MSKEFKQSTETTSTIPCGSQLSQEQQYVLGILNKIIQMQILQSSYVNFLLYTGDCRNYTESNGLPCL